MEQPPLTPETTFGEAITAVPQLRSACSLVLTDNTPGSGLKLLRQVSKQLRTAMLCVVQGYTLNLNGSGTSLIKEMTVLVGAQLSRLDVVFTANDGGFPLNKLGAHAIHLSCFITGMGLAIKGVTRLEVDVQSANGSTVDEVAELLSPLALACPALQQLRMTGDIGNRLLVAFGKHCSKLWCLEVMEGVSFAALEDVHLVMPGLTHCKVEELPKDVGGLAFTQPCCLRLLSCANLTSLDVGVGMLSVAMWQALPMGLKELCCPLDQFSPTGIHLLEKLEVFWCVCGPRNDVSLVTLVSALRVMPILKGLGLSCQGNRSLGIHFTSRVHMICAPSHIQYLVYFHERLISGLNATTYMYGCEEGCFAGVSLSLMTWDDPDLVSDFPDMIPDMAMFLSLLPPLPAITGLVLTTEIVQPSFAALTKGIASVFPSLQALAFEINVLDSKQLVHISKLPALLYLLLEEVQVSNASIALLCTRLPSLKALWLVGCVEFSDTERNFLLTELDAWGYTTELVALSCRVTPEDEINQMQIAE